jgi:hypothetical protein
MPTLAQFQNGIYVAGNYNGPPANTPHLRDAAGTTIHALQMGGVPLPVGSHYSLNFLPGGVAPSAATTPTVSVGATVPDPTSGGQIVPFGPPGPAGNAVFLEFKQDMICSAILPNNPASNVDYFYTSNLSGCSIFIDQIAANNDLIVYHANRVSLTATPNMTMAQYLATTPFANQFQMARNTMRADHTSARNALAAAMGGVAINSVAQLERADYFLSVENEMARKRNMGRTNVAIGVAGTNVMGFRVGGAWQFWWQTWTILTYDRPANAPKALTHGLHQGMVLGTGRLLDAQRFF